MMPLDGEEHELADHCAYISITTTASRLRGLRRLDMIEADSARAILESYARLAFWLR